MPNTVMQKQCPCALTSPSYCCAGGPSTPVKTHKPGGPCRWLHWLSEQPGKHALMTPSELCIMLRFLLNAL